LILLPSPGEITGGKGLLCKAARSDALAIVVHGAKRDAAAVKKGCGECERLDAVEGRANPLRLGGQPMDFPAWTEATVGRYEGEHRGGENLCVDEAHVHVVLQGEE
jgi:hypothetical protein